MSSSEFGLTDKEVVYELAAILHSGILEILGYGIYTGVYFVALHPTLSRKTERRSAILITIMWVLVTIHASITWSYLDNIYVQHGVTRETQLTSALLQNKFFLISSVVDAAVTFISLLLADMTMIWRCWVLYGRRWRIVIIPGLSLVTGSVCYIWQTILVFTSASVWNTEQTTNLRLTFLSTTVLTNIFCTTAIVYRPLRVNGWRNLPKARTYRRIMETLIESSFLYTTIYVIRIGFQIHTQYFTKEVDERVQFAEALGYSITGIAPTLIIACLAASHPQPADSLARTRFDRSASTHTTVVDVDLERSRFQEDFDGPADRHPLPVGSLSQTVSSKEDLERGEIPPKGDHV